MNNKKKELDINMTEPIVTECWNYCRLAVALAVNNRNWYVDKFWEVNIYDGFMSYYYEADSERRSMPNYDKVLDIERINANIDIVPQIIEAIDKEGYPLLYIKSNKSKIAEHEVLVYGYDIEEKKALCLIYVGQPNYWEKSTFSFEEIEYCFKEEVNELKKDKEKMLYYWGLGFPASILYKKGNNDKPDLYAIYKSIRHMLNSGYQGATGVQLYYDQDEYWVNIHRGIEIYKMFYDNLYSLICENENYINENVDVIKSVYKVLESKRKIIDKIKYLQDGMYIRNIESIIPQLERLCYYLENALILLEKYWVRKSKKYVEKMRTVFKTAEITDKAILEQLMEIFSAEVRKELDMDTELYECDENELKNSPICRYITYEIQTKENYIKAYLHRFIMQSDSIYIFGLEQSELDAINESNKVGVQIDNVLSDEYSSSLPYRTELYLCKATLVEQLEQQELIKELYERKYNEKPSENMLCLLIEEKI